MQRKTALTQAVALQVFAQVAKQCLHSPLAERAAGGQCSTSSAFARSAKVQRRPYNFFRDEVPSDPQAQVRLRRLFVGCASQPCFSVGCRDLVACVACVPPLSGVLALGAQPHTTRYASGHRHVLEHCCVPTVLGPGAYQGCHLLVKSFCVPGTYVWPLCCGR